VASVTEIRRGCIAVFAKPPRPGEVKTRLAPDLGEAGAAALAGAFFLDTWASVSSVEWADVVLATTDVGAPEWQLPEGTPVWAQGEGDLGQRMEHVLSRALARYPFALAVGTDAPGLPDTLLRAARHALSGADAVLGPSEDGGFYLVGLRRCPTGLFADLPWSADQTFDRTLERFRVRGLRTAVLPPWFDVDTGADLDRLRKLLAAGRVVAPETARVLAQPAASTST
jgi:rSAM/selenodomain-associated transferase 1